MLHFFNIDVCILFHFQNNALKLAVNYHCHLKFGEAFSTFQKRDLLFPNGENITWANVRGDFKCRK